MSKTLSYAVSILGSFTAVLLFVFVARATEASKLFFWHPISLTLGYLLLMTQGTLLLVSEHSMIAALSGISSRKAKVSLHFWLQIVGTILITIGFGTIFANKIVNGKLHFTSWHSWIGLVTCIVSWFQFFLGVWMYMSRVREVISWVLTLPPDITIKKIHRAAGAITFFLSMITFVLATMTGYAERSFPSSVNMIVSVNVVIITLAILPLSIRMNVPSWLQ